MDYYTWLPLLVKHLIHACIPSPVPAFLLSQWLMSYDFTKLSSVEVFVVEMDIGDVAAMTTKVRSVGRACLASRGGWTNCMHHICILSQPHVELHL